MFSASCVLGAIQSGASQKQEKALAEYGRKIGIAFQITDDLLDLAGDRKKTGKQVGNDMDKNKLTLPLINLLANTRGKSKGGNDKKTYDCQGQQACLRGNSKIQRLHRILRSEGEGVRCKGSRGTSGFGRRGREAMSKPRNSSRSEWRCAN